MFLLSLMSERYGLRVDLFPLKVHIRIIASDLVGTIIIADFLILLRGRSPAVHGIVTRACHLGSSPNLGSGLCKG